MGWNRRFEPRGGRKKNVGADQEDLLPAGWRLIPYDLKRRVMQSWLKRLFIDMMNRQGTLNAESLSRGNKMAAGKAVVDLIEYYNTFRKSGVAQRVRPDESEMNRLAQLRVADHESWSEIVEPIYERNRRNLEMKTQRIREAPRNQTLDE